MYDINQINARTTTDQCSLQKWRQQSGQVVFLKVGENVEKSTLGEIV